MACSFNRGLWSFAGPLLQVNYVVTQSRGVLDCLGNEDRIATVGAMTVVETVKEAIGLGETTGCKLQNARLLSVPVRSSD